MKFTYLCAAFACIFSLAVQPLSAGKKKKVQNQEQKVALGVWDDVDKGATVESLILWMKPFDEAGIKNYYMCGSPEEVARYIEAAKSYQGAKVHAWMFTVNAPGDSAALVHPEWFDVNRTRYTNYDYDPYVNPYKYMSHYIL